MKVYPFAVYPCALAVLIALGCGGTTTNSTKSSTEQQTDTIPQITSDLTKPLLPLAVGNHWSYRVTELATNEISTKETTVVDYRAMDGKKAGIQAFVTESETGASKSVVFLEVKGDVVVRHREDTVQAGALMESKILIPSSFRGPEAMVQAAQTWRDQFTEETYDPAGNLTKSKSQDFAWAVESVSDAVTVPAGTFPAVKLSRKNPANGKLKYNWWAPGVGKIKEEDSTSREELTACQVQ